jgi:SAM-dependent methyltransferase
MSSAGPIVPTAPTGFDKDSFFAGAYWHQKWQLFRDVYTPGANPIQAMCDDFHLPQDLSGKRVLDIGAWNGCLSFECERRNAREIVALSPEDPDITGFNKLHGILQSEKVRYVRGTVYDLNPRKLGYFDIVLFCGVLYHLRYPLLGIDNIRRVCQGDVYIETVISDSQLLLLHHGRLAKMEMKKVSRNLVKASLWQFYRKDEMDADPSNWFGPNSMAVIQAFESAGFRTQRVASTGGRASFHGKLKDGPPEFLAGSAEGHFYNAVASPLFGADAYEDGPGRVAAQSESVSEECLTNVLTSQEYYEKNGNSDGAWVDSLYRCLLGQTAWQAAANQPLRKVFEDDSTYRQGVMRYILTSTDYRTRVAAGYYATYLGRTASADEIGLWLKHLKNGITPDIIQAAFLASDEYFANQGKNHQRWLGCVCAQLLQKSDLANQKSYLQALEAKTVTRAEIVGTILKSPEYCQHLLQTLRQTFLNWSASSPDAVPWVADPRHKVAA